MFGWIVEGLQSHGREDVSGGDCQPRPKNPEVDWKVALDVKKAYRMCTDCSPAQSIPAEDEVDLNDVLALNLSLLKT